MLIDQRSERGRVTKVFSASCKFISDDPCQYAGGRHCADA